MQSGYPRTLPVLFDRVLRSGGDRTAIVGAGRAVDYNELRARSTALAAGLRDRGVGPEDRVAVLMDNRPAYVETDVAILRAGATRLPLNPMDSPARFAHVLRDARADAVVVGPEYAATVADIADDIDSIEVRVVLGDDPPAGFTRFEAVIDGGAAGARFPEPDPTDIAGHFYTGGTTGEPRGVLYSQETLVETLVAHLAELHFSEEDVGLVTTPLAHSGGTFCWATLLAGGTVHLQDEFEPRRVLRTIDEKSISWTFVVPTMLYRLLTCDVAEWDLASLDRLLYGAAPARPDRVREAVERFGPVLVQFYGQTEVPNLVATLDRVDHARALEAGDENRLRSAGTPCHRVGIRIVDDDGVDQQRGDPGEVVASAPYAFDGYHERPDATAETLVDGWVHTGDVGVLDEEGYLTLLDRKRGVIVSGGLNVYAREVERSLTDHPGVDRVVVIGVPDEEWGEAVHAVVVPQEEYANGDGNGVTADVLRSFVRERRSNREVPKSIRFVDELPTTPLGKVDRETVRDRYWEDEDRNI